MESLVKLYLKWEIQVVVLGSFTLQVWLFFTGSLGRRSVDIFLRFSIWIAYLGADFVAVYALGYLARHQDIPVPPVARHDAPMRTQSLAFFWAPFLLNHLGGQDTITAFSMEDNNLWLRHSLNLVVQVVLAAYVFWKSVGGHSVELLVSGAFVFVAGVIKYGERACSLMRGSSESLRNSPVFVGQYLTFRPIHGDSGYYSVAVSYALRTMPYVVNIFAERVRYVAPDYESVEGIPLREDAPPRGLATDTAKRFLKAAEIQLAMLRDDLYTKAPVLRTRTAIIFRCISQISGMLAFVLFHTSDKRRYSEVDVAITYSLFIGAIFLDISAMFIFMMSPCTWAWLKIRGWDWLGSMSWSLLSSCIGWPEKRPQWSNSMGQYDLRCWYYSRDPPRSCCQRVMYVVKSLVNFFNDPDRTIVRGRNKNIIWLSKLLDTEYVEADEKTVGCILKGIDDLCHEFSSDGTPRKWPNIGPFMHKKQRDYFTEDFGAAIVMMHMFTEEQLKLLNAEPDADGMAQVCRKLSNYMMHLLVSFPSMLPINSNSEATLIRFQDRELPSEQLCGIKPNDDGTTLEEMADMWARLLIYAAGKSRGEMHAAKLGTGGELITLVWLLMATAGLGDSESNRILLANPADGATVSREAYAFVFNP